MHGRLLVPLRTTSKKEQMTRTQLIYIFDVHESFGESFDRTEDVQCGTESRPGKICMHRLREGTDIG